ncbi:hypothetical protein [Alkalibacter saccharofermentans]|uniref:Uncharacterized protein n=1 Tax=Alkalibacter saccharofermentans DSM 14828 TaxID=1120975 RepID=A0A1M4ZIB5_9FIRM|nr:hypothetical protein [Alkalibacter saccharofermentans]SHF17800.1 hypothetical protein SAMN02746064_02061 [Alkalibacter saccharofermentans DSM 14828]
MSRERQRTNKKKKHREEMFDLKVSVSLYTDPTPYEAVKEIINKTKKRGKTR